jgi:hypothetical protein
VVGALRAVVFLIAQLRQFLVEGLDGGFLLTDWRMLFPRGSSLE